MNISVTYPGDNIIGNNNSDVTCCFKNERNATGLRVAAYCYLSYKNPSVPPALKCPPPDLVPVLCTSSVSSCIAARLPEANQIFNTHTQNSDLCICNCFK